ncbi:hypothetical protein [Streptomyces sporangiiformans]|uniref:DUF4352 domain-containing protein n=1 Tax=Streptomyces sporangiiformans TaxID=2315329 RepID=A0A505DKQ3_9ACTN|nr:hypothetical protein [Streptomyces sporangiiformans]TPQ19639.1 hypothetical protein FGD71_024775 [Streptomyces sporangiiformans]
MNFRHTMKGRRALTAVAITTGLVLTVAGCGGGGDDDKSDTGASSSAPAKSNDDGGDKESQAPEENKVLAESKQGDISLVITSAARDTGGYVTVSGTVNNGGSKLFVAADWRGDEKELQGNASSVAGASLVDQAGKKKYLVLRDTEGRCLCTRFVGGVKSGETADWYAQFPAPPEGTTKVSFQVGSMPPASVELSEGE